MNKVFLAGRLVADPEIKQAQNETGSSIARYRLAVDRRTKREGEPDADFISCVTFGKTAEFVGKYLRKGMKIIVCGRIQTGTYTKQDGTKVYTTDVIVDEHEFCEKKETETESEAELPSLSVGNTARYEDVTGDDNLPF